MITLFKTVHTLHGGRTVEVPVWLVCLVLFFALAIIGALGKR